MSELPPKNDLLIEFAKERSIRRTVRVLKAKRAHLTSEINQLLTHLSLLLPRSEQSGNLRESSSEIILEALSRLDDDVLTLLLTEVMEVNQREL